MKLHRHLGVSCNAAWRMRHKLMQVMMERDRHFPLTGRVELDDAYLGGERSGGKRGRGVPGKTPSVAAVETNGEGHPLRKSEQYAGVEAGVAFVHQDRAALEEAVHAPVRP